MKKTIVIALASLIAAGGVATYLRGSENATVNQAYFQGLDKKRLRKAYRQMLKDITTGKFFIDGLSEEELNAQLHRRYRTTV